MVPTSTSPDRDPFLAMIDARIAALRHLRDSYLAARAAGAIGQTGEGLPPVGPPAPLPFQATMPEEGRGRAPRGALIGQVTGLLSEWPKPLKVREIGKALRQNHLTFKANTIHSILHRLRHRGVVVRTAEGWTMSRRGAEAAAPGNPSRRPSPVRATASRRPRSPRPASAPMADRQPGGLAWRIESLLRSHGKPVAARYVAAETGEPLNVVGLALGRMVKQQRIEKQADGHFLVRLPESEPAGSAGADAPDSGR